MTAADPANNSSRQSRIESGEVKEMRRSSLFRRTIAWSATGAMLAACSKKTDPGSAGVPSTSVAAAASVVAPEPASTASAVAARVQPAALSPADRARYDALVSKCGDNDVTSCTDACDFDAKWCSYITSLMLQRKAPDEPTTRAKVNEKGCSKGELN